MLPRVARLTQLGVYRDGGSLIACFESEDKNEYCLLFPVLTNKELEKLGYKSPLLEKYVRTEYKSPVTGVASPDWKQESNPVSWNEARALLGEMKPHLEGFVSDYLWVFQEMQDAAARDGGK